MTKKDRFVTEYLALVRRYGAIVAQVYREDGEYSPFTVMRVRPADLECVISQIAIELQVEPTALLYWER